MSQEKQLKHGIPFAWHPQSQRMVSAAEVANGLRCNCVCAACTARLVAKQGGARIWHFAHHRESNCAFAAETAIHSMAKQLIFERRGIFVPHRTLSKTVHGKSRVWSEKLHVDVQQSGFQHITDCWIEKSIGGASTDCGYRRPDLIAQLDGYPIAIEIHNTHGVDLEKTEWLKQQGFSVLEIDVSDLAVLSTDSYKDALEQRLFGTDTHACWLAHMGDGEAWDRLDKLEREIRIEKKAVEEELLARLKARESKNQRKAAFLKRIRDVEHLNIPFERCTLRVGRNEERVSLKVYGHAPDLLFSKTVSLARQHGGKYNPRVRCWEFYTYQRTKEFFDLLGAQSRGILDDGLITTLQSAVPPKEAEPSLVLVCAEHLLPTYFNDPDLQELFDERAGIFEHEGGMSRENAEQHAMVYVKNTKSSSEE